MRNYLTFGPISVRVSRKGIAPWGYALVHTQSGLSIWSRDSGGGRTIAAFHSPHSLTWSWVLSLRRQPFAWPKFFALRNSVGFGAGFGQLLSFSAHRDNNGWQFILGLLWRSLSWSRQKPMFYRDLYQRQADELVELREDNRRLRRLANAAWSAEQAG